MSGDVGIRQLEYLAALARERHFGRAAAACHASQSALSTGLQNLERQLGVTIVRRDRSFAGFTPEGSRVVGWAHRILAERDALRLDLDRLRNGLSATIRIGAIPTAVPITPLLTAALVDRHPLAAVRIEVLPAAEISRRLAAFDLDAGLTYLSEDAQPTPSVLPLYREGHALLTPEGNPLAERDTIELAELDGLAVCALPTTMQNRQFLDAALAQAGARVRAVVETGTVDTLYAHITDRRWSAVVAHTWLLAHDVPVGMRAIPLAERIPTPPVGLIAGGPGAPSLASAALLTAAKEAGIADRLQREDWPRARE
ncbi:LysR family transcriptional regulator [Pseudonocardia ailaonensis]|uniref:LysR family transcriptional regulator n=1 Tax=Pseudonocardia ailaonensis TaxID=367279 RepID=A0ABN2NCC1_9PSEU